MIGFTDLSLFLDFFTSLFTPTPTTSLLDNACNLSIATLFNFRGSQHSKTLFWNNGKFLIKGIIFTAQNTKCTSWHYKIHYTD
jgi:hypothetical protein